MYIVRRQLNNGGYAFKTDGGWVKAIEGESLDLSEALRFTKGERTNNTLPQGEEWVWYGCYSKGEGP